ncbi:MAG: hypothetical protein JJV97_01340 [SAR324 cluster bacterium]|nr:hypothetical protein [SAR324 cluster bacterium]
MIFNLYKPRAISSNRFLQWFKHKFSISKAGFLGTLDPLAQGVLPIFTGKSTKLIALLDDNFKSYRFIIKLGWHSASLDAEGALCKDERDFIFPDLKILTSFLDKKLGKSMQVPPKRSAVKIKGVNAYKLSRQNEKLDLTHKAKEINLYSYQIHSLSFNQIELSIVSSRGFYVRSLAKDIANEFGTSGYVDYLVRESNGKTFNQSSSIGLVELVRANNLDQLSTVDLRALPFKITSSKIIDDFLWKKICSGDKFDVGSSGLGDNFLNIKEKETPTKKEIILTYANSPALCCGTLEYSQENNWLRFKPRLRLAY